MIICDSARHTTNLYYSILKFLNFRGIIWSGDRLPLSLSSLGELFSVQVRLSERSGQRCSTAYWERGYLFAPFEAGRLYDLDMRLEYHTPVMVTAFPSDFQSIHPKTFSTTLAFASASGGRALLSLGSEDYSYNLDEEVDCSLTSGQQVRLFREQDYCTFSVNAHTPVPYGHRQFPVLAFKT